MSVVLSSFCYYCNCATLLPAELSEISKIFFKISCQILSFKKFFSFNNFIPIYTRLASHLSSSYLKLFPLTCTATVSFPQRGFPRANKYLLLKLPMPISRLLWHKLCLAYVYMLLGKPEWSGIKQHSLCSRSHGSSHPARRTRNNRADFLVDQAADNTT